MDLKYSVGIDVDSKTLELNFSVINNLQAVSVFSSRQFNNTACGFGQIDRWIESIVKTKSFQ